MARAVVLLFADNTSAEEFIQEHGEGAVMGDAALNEFCEVIGLYPVPTMFCDPTDPVHKMRGKTGRGFAKGKKYGWWVCGACNKPMQRKTKDGLCRSVISQATNLLHDSESELETAFDRGWGALNRGREDVNS